MADRGQDVDKWLTLTEAANRTGHTQESIRQRIRRGKLSATTGNDGIVRIAVRDLADLPPPDESADIHAQTEQAIQDAAHVVQDMTMDLIITTMDDLRTTLAQTRTDLVQIRTILDSTLDKSRVDHERAERAEAQTGAEAARAALAEARLASAEAALSEARTPWIVRVLRAFRG